jgi:hypothetical protein
MAGRMPAICLYGDPKTEFLGRGASKPGALHAEIIDWFLTLPLWLESQGSRGVAIAALN